MTAYTLFSQPSSPAVLESDTAAYTLGVQFSVSVSATLTALWFYSPPSAAELPETIAVFAVSGATLVHSESATWSGAAGSGWVRAAFASPPSLTASMYTAAVLKTGAVNWYGETNGYWTTGAGAGGITNGPLTAPNSASASPGQDSFHVGATLTYPASTFGGANYWIDPEVTAGPTITGSGAVTLKKATVAGSGSERIAGSAAMARRKMALAGAASERIGAAGAIALRKAAPAAAGTERIGASGSVTAPKMTVSGTGPQLVTGAAAVTLKKMAIGSAAPPLPAWPDVELALCDLLGDLGTCGTETLPGLAATLPYIRVTRTGGSDDGITDVATVSIDVFAASGTAAKVLAGQCRSLLVGSGRGRPPARATAHGVIDRVTTVSGPVRLPPTDSGSLRMAVASYSVSMRRQAS